MYGGDYEEGGTEFFDTQRQAAIQKRLKQAKAKFGEPDELSSLSTSLDLEDSKTIKKPDLYVSCSGDAFPLDRNQKQQLLNNYESRTPPQLYKWLAEHTVNSATSAKVWEISGQDKGPFFQVAVRYDSDGSAARFYSAVGDWEKGSSREAALAQASSDVKTWESYKDFGTAQKVLLDEVEFRLISSSERVRLGVQCIGSPDRQNWLGGPIYEKGVNFQNIQRSDINRFYWVQSIVQKRFERKTQQRKSRISVQYTFCVADLNAGEGGSSGEEGRSVKSFVLKKRDSSVWLNSTSDLSKLVKTLSLAPTIQSLDEQLRAVIDRQLALEEAHKLEITMILKAFEELWARLGVRGTVGIVQACSLFGKDAYDPKTGKGNPEAIQKCIEEKFQHDLFYNQITSLKEKRAAAQKADPTLDFTKDPLAFVDTLPDTLPSDFDAITDIEKDLVTRTGKAKAT